MIVVLQILAELLHGARYSRAGYGGEGRVEEILVDFRHILAFLQELQDVVVHESAGLHGSTRWGFRFMEMIEKSIEINAEKAGILDLWKSMLSPKDV